jgi:hypothetical protein
MASPRFRPAGLLLEAGRWAVMLDGGPGAEPPRDRPLDAWLVCDERSELQPSLRRLSADRGLDPITAPFSCPAMRLEPLAVRHTSHPTVGYRITAGERVAAWAPEFLDPPAWAEGVDLLFAEAAGWARPIRFASGAGGHAPALEVSRWAASTSIRRLVFAHVGRPTIRALDAGQRPPFGEIGAEGRTYELT